MKLRFRTVVTLCILGVASLAAVPAVVSEIRRPWNELGVLVHTAEGMLATTMASLPAADRELMARFARKHLDTGEVDAAGFVGQIAPGAGKPPPGGSGSQHLPPTRPLQPPSPAHGACSPLRAQRRRAPV